MMKRKLAPLAGLVALALTVSAHAAEERRLVADAVHNLTATRGAMASAYTIDSRILHETRRIFVLTPPSFQRSAPSRHYPVTVVLDGEYLMPTVAVVMDELSRNGQIPESIIVGIENISMESSMASNEKRVYDLTPPGLSVSGSDRHQGGDAFLDFIEKELLPEIDQKFRGAAPRILIGVSSGAVLATYAAATRPAFAVVISLDAPIALDDNWLAMRLRERARKTSPLRYATLEAKFGWPEAEWKELTASAPTTWRLFREKLPLEGHETVQMVGAYTGLRQLFGDYSRLSAPMAPTASILPYYETVSASLGSAVVPPRRVLREVIENLISEGRGAAARATHDTLVQAYGGEKDDAALLSQIADAERLPPPSETVESLLSVRFPSPEEAAGIIGDWTGDIWMRDGQPRKGDLVLRIRVVDGRVIGETVRRGPGGDSMVRRWDYLKITPEGFTWGVLNGRRPRGVMLFVGKVKGDVLGGESRWGGVRVTMPDGSPSEPLHFSFKRIRN